MRYPKQSGDTLSEAPKTDYSQLYGWGGLMVAVLIFLGLSWDTALHHFALGLLIALIFLSVSMALFEGLWWAAGHALQRMGLKSKG